MFLCISIDLLNIYKYALAQAPSSSLVQNEDARLRQIECPRKRNCNMKQLCLQWSAWFLSADIEQRSTCSEPITINESELKEAILWDIYVTAARRVLWSNVLGMAARSAKIFTCSGSSAYWDAQIYIIIPSFFLEFMYMVIFPSSVPKWPHAATP